MPFQVWALLGFYRAIDVWGQHFDPIFKGSKEFDFFDSKSFESLDMT
jgi:hypothetical protein